MEKTCVFCEIIFLANPKQCNQQYCTRPECQRARKRKWQKDKLAKDSTYRENQTAAQQEWCSRNKGYWKGYRKRNSGYTERNRKKQKERNRRRRAKTEIAKMDASGAKNAVSPGSYWLVPFSNGVIAKMDAIIVKIDVVSRGCSTVVAGP